MTGPMIGHLYKSDVVIHREDGVTLRFKTYQFGVVEWGYELVRANGESTSCIADPDYYSEEGVIQAIQEHAPRFKQNGPHGHWFVSVDLVAEPSGPRGP